MANPHFANLGDVWKHLWLAGVLETARPRQYVETHAGSARYPLVEDAERAIGVRTFLAAAQASDLLRRSAYTKHIAGLAAAAQPWYPGSPLLAMMVLGRACRYIFCDTDQASVTDLLAERDRLGLVDHARVVHGDGLTETLSLLEARELGSASLVHVDPFDFDAADRGVSARDLVRRLVMSAVPVIAWYHLATPAESLRLFGEIMPAAPGAPAWCAELQVQGPRANQAGIGSGCGILLAGAPLAPAPELKRAADAYITAFGQLSARLGVSVAGRFVTGALAGRPQGRAPDRGDCKLPIRALTQPTGCYNVATDRLLRSPEGWPCPTTSRSSRASSTRFARPTGRRSTSSVTRAWSITIRLQAMRRRWPASSTKSQASRRCSPT